MVNDNSISEQDHSISERVLIVEVRSQLIFLAKQRHCPVDEDTCARPERVCQNCDDIVKAGGNFRLFNSFLCKYIIDYLSNCRSHAVECVSKTVVHGFMEQGGDLGGH